MDLSQKTTPLPQIARSGLCGFHNKSLVIVVQLLRNLLLQDLPFDVYEEMHIINPLPVSLYIEYHIGAIILC